MKLRNELLEGIACDSVGHPHSIVGRAICLSVHPGKMMLFPFLSWFKTHYEGKHKYARTLFGLHMILLGSALTLGIVALFVWLRPSTPFEDKIRFEATVAPHEIVSGAPSTLVIRYTNDTREELRDTQLQLTFPNHFLLQGVLSNNQPVTGDTINLGTVAVGQTGTVHVQGVMFGDVGGQQTFRSKLHFVHGKANDIAGDKTSDYTFSPTHSTLSLSLKLPERLLAFQEVEGEIAYQNSGNIDFPVITIDPEWPVGFSTTTTQLSIPTIKAGETGHVSFRGYLGDVGDSATWIFHPSFTFGDDRYKQETLTHTASVVPAPLVLSHTTDKSSLQPGATTTFHLTYENVSSFPISDVTLGIESNSPLFPKQEYTAKPIPLIEAGAHGTIDLQVPLRSTIHSSDTSTYEHLTVTTRATAHYTLGDGSVQHVTSKGPSIQSPLTTPLVFESFGRYTTPSGDQIGRGPLPPRTEDQTSYWIFWNIAGTTNPIEHVVIEGTLPPNVTFTGRESSSQNGGVTFDETTRRIRWTTDKLTPTLSPTSKIVGVAFELELTPTPDQLNTSPLLIKNVVLTAVDQTTGAALQRSTPNITSALSNTLSAKKSIVTQ